MKLVYLIPTFPLLGALSLVFFGRKLKEPLAGYIATLAVGLSFIFSIVVWISFLSYKGNVFVQHMFVWINVGSFKVDAALRVDPLSLTMVLFVTGVSTLIHFYSVEYMHKDIDFPKFFLYLNLFVASMILLVLANNMLLTFVGWEGVGVCSYFLISFWHERPTAATAGKKAMIVNRIADVGFLLSMFLTIHYVHSLNYSSIFLAAGHLSKPTIDAIVLLAFVGAMGKSAQTPLYGWLADAMEGPTPVSALIHAATMVTAGVYLMVRLSPLLAFSPDVAHVIAIVGILTAFLAAMAATAQDDIKKVLAYSTVSQLGYMFVGVGTGAYAAAIFLMVTHAFYKALLFLGSGSVIHGMHDEQNLKKMGALRIVMPITALAFFTGWMAIAGVPPFAGFWSKGDVLVGAFSESWAIWIVGLITAGITSYYMGREYCLAFLGPARWLKKTDKKSKKLAKTDSLPETVDPHEPSFIMLVPIVTLAVLALIGGILNLPFASSLQFLDRFLKPVIAASPSYMHVSGLSQVVLGTLDGIFAIGGGLIAYFIWSKTYDKPSLEFTFLKNAWYIDKSGDVLIARSSTKLAEVSDGFIEPKVIDGAVVGISKVVVALGILIRKSASGFVRREAAVIAAGLVVILIIGGLRGGL